MPGRCRFQRRRVTLLAKCGWGGKSGSVGSVSRRTLTVSLQMAGQMDRNGWIDAAVTIARRYGVDVRQPHLLRSTNNLVVHLFPAPIVAKVSGRTDENGQSPLQHELAVGIYLARLGAPTAEPSPDMPAVVHTVGGLNITFWRYYWERNTGDIPCSRLGSALREFHRCLATYPGPLPTFRLRDADAGDLVRDRVSPRLKERDRVFLLKEQARIQALLTRAKFRPQPIHGGPNRYNWLDTEERALLIDLETVCTGPRELDIAYLGCATEFPDVDQELLVLMRDAVSLKVAVACWTHMDAVPQLAWHAAHHLGALRGRAWARRRANPSSK